MLVYQRVWLDMYPILFVLHILIVQWKIHQISPGAHRLTLDVPNRIKLHMYIYYIYIYTYTPSNIPIFPVKKLKPP